MNALRFVIHVSLAVAFASGARAQATTEATQPAASAAAGTMIDGEVRKVDKEAGKITLRHGPIAHLDMRAMNMVFRVTDPKMLDQVKEGDKVRFMADRVNGLFTITRIEAAR
jgi:Cu(I)/Ag(I) efflux system periplasmic protein CusF